MFFDVRRGAHSVGSVVRDAACYVLWSLARTQNIETFSPFSLKLARDLIKLALFDREVHIRRAASAAFQEHVGRMVRYLLFKRQTIVHKVSELLGDISAWYSRTRSDRLLCR